MVMLDTDICLSLMQGKIAVSDLVFVSGEEIAVSYITAGELFLAANGSSDPVHNRIVSEKFLLTVRILHSDMAVLKYIADVTLTLKRKGIAANQADIVIYSMAKVFGARLITSNSKRYCFT
jgi:predicted nucleic acid-binding protein